VLLELGSEIIIWGGAGTVGSSEEVLKEDKFNIPNRASLLKLPSKEQLNTLEPSVARFENGTTASKAETPDIEKFEVSEEKTAL
jgi:hypothetical protein